MRRDLLIAGILLVIVGFALLILGMGIFQTKPSQNQYLEPVAVAPYPPPIIVDFEGGTHYDVYVNPIPTPQTNHTDNPMIIVYNQSQNIIVNRSLILAGTVYDSATGSTHPNYRYTIRIDSSGVYNITLQGLTGYRVLIFASPSTTLQIDPYPIIGGVGLFIAGVLLIGLGSTMKPKNIHKNTQTSTHC